MEWRKEVLCIASLQMRRLEATRNAPVTDRMILRADGSSAAGRRHEIQGRDLMVRSRRKMLRVASTRKLISIHSCR